MKRLLALITIVAVVVIGATSLLYSATDTAGKTIEQDFLQFLDSVKNSKSSQYSIKNLVLPSSGYGILNEKGVFKKDAEEYGENNPDDYTNTYNIAKGLLDNKILSKFSAKNNFCFEKKTKYGVITYHIYFIGSGSYSIDEHYSDYDGTESGGGLYFKRQKDSSYKIVGYGGV